MARPSDAASQVKLILGGSEVIIATSYNVKQSVFEQPCAFAIDIGAHRLAKELVAKYPANTPFELRIGDVRQFSGATDGWSVSGGASGTKVVLRGRDSLAPVWDAYVQAEKSWNDVTCAELTSYVLTEAVTGDFTLNYGNEANRSAKSGSVAREIKPSDKLAKSTSKKKIQAKLGQSWYSDLLKPHLDRAGLFIMAESEPNTFTLTTANAYQEPCARIIRRRGATTNTIVDYSYRNEPTTRFSRCDVHGRRGGGAEARSKVLASVDDLEMQELGYEKPLIIADNKVTTVEQAEFLAKRKIAEMRRQAWSLEYTVRGHVVEGLKSTLPGGFIVWTPDTVVQIEDEDIGISGNYYLESVDFSGSPHATTRLRFMRPEDAVFGSEDD